MREFLFVRLGVFCAYIKFVFFPSLVGESYRFKVVAYWYEC